MVEQAEECDHSDRSMHLVEGLELPVSQFLPDLLVFDVQGEIVDVGVGSQSVTENLLLDLSPAHLNLTNNYSYVQSAALIENYVKRGCRLYYI